jgi:SUKH-4 immunity protein
MSDEYLDRLPRFTLVTYSAPTGIPNGWDAKLLVQGAPDGLVCEAARELTLLEDPEAGPLVCFGSGHLANTYVCVYPRTKQVVSIFVHGPVGPGVPQPEVIRSSRLVNSSLDHFIAAVRAVTERFPYDSEVTGKGLRGEEDEDNREERRFNEWTQAVLDLGETLDRLDPALSTTGSEFWGEFLADVGMGMYATKDFLNPPDF